MAALHLNMDDPRVVEMLRAWGTPYLWAGGAPPDGTHPDWWAGARVAVAPHARGYDCSGFVQAALVRLGYIDPAERVLTDEDPDRSAESLRQATVVVRAENVQFGDLVFYGPQGPTPHATHVMLVVGDGIAMGACGGGPNTHGDDPRAYVQLQRFNFRADLLSFGRLVAKGGPHGPNT